MTRILSLYLTSRPGARMPADEKELHALALWSMRFSPAVAMDMPDGLLLDVTGCERLFRGEANLLHQLLDVLRAMGYAARGAIADTIGAAWALAHAGPDACTMAPPGHGAAAIASLPPWALRLPRDVLIKLDGLGIRRIEALLMLPRSALPVRFGEALLDQLDLALGRLPEVLMPVRPPARIAAQLNFETPLEQRAPLTAALNRLVAAIVRQMTPRGLGARRVELTLFRPHDPPTTRRIMLTRPSRSVRHLADLLHAQLEGLPVVAAATGDPFVSAGIAAVALNVIEAARIDAEQGDLFEPPDPARDATAELTDRLMMELGPGAVVRAMPVESHWPERAWAPADMHPAADGSTGEVGGGAKAGTRAGTGAGGARRAKKPVAAPAAPVGGGARVDRPLCVLPNPQSIHTLAIVPDGPPIMFRLGGMEHRVRKADGPERLSAEWWTGAAGERDYYRIETADGTWFWVFREWPGGGWFIHGVFE